MSSKDGRWIDSRDCVENALGLLNVLENEGADQSIPITFLTRDIPGLKEEPPPDTVAEAAFYYVVSGEARVTFTFWYCRVRTGVSLGSDDLRLRNCTRNDDYPRCLAQYAGSCLTYLHKGQTYPGTCDDGRDGIMSRCHDPDGNLTPATYTIYVDANQEGRSTVDGQGTSVDP